VTSEALRLKVAGFANPVPPMLPAPIPADDDARLRALRELLILDTPPEERFDRIVEFAAAEFDVPIALISLVDRDRQWFKARVGLDACETAREISFCGHAILQRDVFEVLDATLDPRFADNPLVLGAPFVRFYAGAPLVLPGGAAIGTLCLIDTRAREFDAMDRAILGTLRDLAIAELVSQGGDA
jgi:GAF domain-containing protein